MGYRENAKGEVDEVPVPLMRRIKWHRVSAALLWAAGAAWAVATDEGYRFGDVATGYCVLSMLAALVAVCWWNINEASWGRW